MKYRIFCKTEQEFKEVESLLTKEECPDDPTHVVESGSLTVIQDNDTWANCGKDYRLQRHLLKQYVGENYFSMSDEELEQAASHFCAPLTDINRFFSSAEQVRLGKDFHRRATECRRDRLGGVVALLFNHLEYMEAGEIVQDLNDYIWKYVELGVEGTTEQDPEGVFDYFVSSSGTSFENNGFLEKLFVPRHGITLQELSNAVMIVLQSGCGPCSEYYQSIVSEE